MRNTARPSPAVPAGAALNMDLAATLGKRLASARVARHLSVGEVAARLLMSPRHINALEQPDLSAFFGAPYFVRAVQKYSTLLDVALPPHLAEELIVPGTRRVATPAPTVQQTASAWFSRLHVVGITSTLVMAAAGIIYYVRIMDPPRVTPQPAASAVALPLGIVTPAAPAPVPPSSDVHAAPAPAPPPSVGAASPGQIVLRRPTWVFVRYANNEVTERRLRSGDGLTFTAPPIYVAVGTVEGVELTLGGRRVEVAPFVSNGQIRIGREDLATLVAR